MSEAETESDESKDDSETEGTTEDTGKSTEEDKRGFPGAVAQVRDDRTLVVNRGSNDGLREDQTMLVYELSDDEIIDPETEESLGKLEIVKGKGIVTHVQDQMATIESITKEPTGSGGSQQQSQSRGPMGGPSSGNPTQGGNPMSGGGPMGGRNPMSGGGGMFSSMAEMMGAGPGGPGAQQPPPSQTQSPGESSTLPFDNPSRGDLFRPANG